MKNPQKELYESFLKFLNPLDLEQTYKTIVAEAMRMAGGSGGSVILAEKGALKRVYSSDPQIKNTDPQKRGRTYDSYKNKRTISLKKSEVTSVHPEFSELKISSYLLIPLINHQRSIGVLSIYKSREKSFSAHEKQLLQNFSLVASLAIRKAQLYSELNKALETRDLFLSMASHELKTPITTIYVYLQLIQRNMKKNKKFDPNWIKTLLDEMVRLTKIIDELLELSKIRSGKLVYNFSEINIKEVIRRSLVNFKATHKHKIIFKDILLEKDKNIIADFDKLTEVAINILDNAAKHSSQGSPIEIYLSKKRDDISIEINDKGKGISKSEVDKIFQDFFKTTDNTKPGMGLGLYLSKQIIDAHKGKIKVDSEKGVGTSVEILLPKLN